MEATMLDKIAGAGLLLFAVGVLGFLTVIQARHVLAGRSIRAEVEADPYQRAAFREAVDNDYGLLFGYGIMFLMFLGILIYGLTEL